jgi:hypothetical protein
LFKFDLLGRYRFGIGIMTISLQIYNIAVELVLAVFCWNRRPPHGCDFAIHTAGPPAAAQSAGSLNRGDAE